MTVIEFVRTGDAHCWVKGCEGVVTSVFTAPQPDGTEEFHPLFCPFLCDDHADYADRYADQ